MGIVVNAVDVFRHHQEENNFHQSISTQLTDILSQTNEKVQEFLDTPIESIAVIDEDNLHLLLRDYFLFVLNRNHFELTEDMYVAFSYTEQLIYDLMLMRARGRAIIEEPYVIDWLMKQEYRTAGDVAIFGYLFFHNSRRNELNKDDYLTYMSGCYSAWYQRSISFNTGRILAGVMPIFLPLIEKMDQDLFRRGVRSI
ncbi:MAG: hypothetical protein WC774_03175 [Candidatus Gracilibacteria bacterium]|jgi:hypothetical protein